MNEIDRKIRLSNKIYPYLSGLSSDLLFLAAINTIFLTTVKMLSASQISLLSAISILITILSQGLVLKIIKKIGNIKSVRLGLLMLFIGAVLITFGSSFITIVIGEIFYNVAFLFKGMDNINALLDNCSKENQQTAILKFNLSRRIVKCILSALFSLLLLKVDIFYVMILLLILALVYLNITMKLYKMIN